MTSLRMRLAMWLIGRHPFVANVEIGDVGGYALRARGSLYLDKSVTLRPSPALVGCIVVEGPL